MNESNQKIPSVVRRCTFLPGRICFFFNSTNTPGQRVSSDVLRYTFLPGRIYFVMEQCLVLLGWREAAFSTYQIVHGLPLPPFFHLAFLECWYLRHETVLSISAWGDQTWGISGHYSVADDATCIGLA